MQAIDQKILSRCYGHGRGHVSTQKDFIDLGSRSHIDNALSRLAQNGKLKRIARGLYEYPRVDKVLGELSPDLDKVAKAMAGREGIHARENNLSRTRSPKPTTRAGPPLREPS